MSRDEIIGYHSEWNLGSPGGWDYQRMTQIIGKAVWQILTQNQVINLELDFDHPWLSPVDGFVNMLAKAHYVREGANPGLVAVVAEEETLQDVIENRNLAERLDTIDNLQGALMAPQELELKNGRVCWRNRPVSVIFMDFNTDVLLKLHRIHGLDPMLQAVREGRVINPRGTEPINAKSVFELITDSSKNSRFHGETIKRTPWTRRFYPRQTEGPTGEKISDLIEWTRRNWQNLVLKPERGYSGKGVHVGGIHDAVDDAISLALEAGDYIVQKKVPLSLWAEDLPELDDGNQQVIEFQVQTDFRCLFGRDELFGFVGRYGQVPTNVGSGGGFQPLAILRSDLSVREATKRINEAILNMNYDIVAEASRLKEQMALNHQFTYLLGPVNIAFRPRLITPGQMKSLEAYCAKIWSDCLILEEMWLAGELDDLIGIEPAELTIAKAQPWKGRPAIFASDGIFSFGAHRDFA